MKIKNLMTDEVKDSKEWAEELKWDDRKFRDYVRQGNTVNGVKYIKWEGIEPEIKEEQEPVQEIAVENDIDIDKYTILNKWVEIMSIHTDYGDIKVERNLFGEQQYRVPMEVYKGLGFAMVNEIIGKANSPKPRTVEDKLLPYVDRWTAPIGGCDYVLDKKGNKHFMKHSPNDPRCRADEWEEVKKEQPKFLDLNEIELI